MVSKNNVEGNEVCVIWHMAQAMLSAVFPKPAGTEAAECFCVMQHVFLRVLLRHISLACRWFRTAHCQPHGFDGVVFGSSDNVFLP
jgi:hypothetical protein